jgi:arsenate reductase (thioredoxin)
MAPVPTVIFVCQHGAAKSVIAAWHLERLAYSQGVAVRALARGTEPEPVILPAAASGLQAEGFDVGSYRPRGVGRPDLAGADRIVSFGPDLAHMAPAGARIEYWTGIPAVSEDFAAARDAIVPRVAALLASMRNDSSKPKLSAPADK